MRQPFVLGDASIAVGARQLVDLPVSKLSNHTPITLPIHVLHGARPGPTFFVTAAIHGDELNGIEIIRRVLRTLSPASMSGTLLAIPIVNAYGFMGRSRYLPDRRDLNRAFPGSVNGSLAGRIAHLLMSQVVSRCQFGVDLHTAAVHRVNLPQIRCEFKKRQRCRELAIAFGAPVILESHERAGSLRKCARDMGVDVLVYEGGEGLRFDEYAIQVGVDGIARLMISTGMLESQDSGEAPPAINIAHAPVWANSSAWVRASESGVFRTQKRIGAMISEGEIVGYIANPYEESDVPVIATRAGIIVGRTTLPIVNLGDALFHIAWSSDNLAVQSSKAISEPLMDEDEIL